jgi:hypothetical protein
MSSDVTKRYDRRPSVATVPICCAGCRRLFQPKRSDALTCSVRCRVAAWRRARRDAAASVQPDAPPTAEVPRGRGITGDPDELGGWRRVPGGRVIPPAESRNTFFVDPDALRRL